jgi:energy-coupling factor transporter ATP-binding protein EcfA2
MAGSDKTLFSSMMGPGTWLPMPMNDNTIREDLPVGTYSIQVHPTSGSLFLRHEDNMVIPEKIYGKNSGYSARIIRMFERNDKKNTGVMLVGEKGAGKTLLAKQISSILRGKNISTYIVNSALHGPSFNAFLSSIPRGLVLFDEMEKVYDKEDQESLLTTFDGTVQTTHLMIVAANDKWALDRNFENRPGRLHYWIEYKGIDSEAIEEYCTDHLNQKNEIPKIVSLAEYLGMFTFDMLVSLVREMNIQELPTEEAMDILNIREDSWHKSHYSHTVKCEGQDITQYVSVVGYNSKSHCLDIDSSHPGSIASLELTFNSYNITHDRVTGSTRSKSKMSPAQLLVLELLKDKTEFETNITNGPSSIDSKSKTITFSTKIMDKIVEVIFKKETAPTVSPFYRIGAF